MVGGFWFENSFGIPWEFLIANADTKLWMWLMQFLTFKRRDKDNKSNPQKHSSFLESQISITPPILRSKNFNWLQNRRKTWVVSRWPSLYFLETPIWQSYCFWKSRLPICFQFSPWQKFPRLQSRSTSPRSLQNYFGLWFTRIWWFWTSKFFHRIPYSWRWLCGSRKFTYGLYSCKSSFYFSKKNVIIF